MTDTWEYRIEVWRSKRIGWRWYVRAYLNGRRDPTVPEGYPWALTLRSAVRRAADQATKRAVDRGANVIELKL